MLDLNAVTVYLTTQNSVVFFRSKVLHIETSPMPSLIGTIYLNGISPHYLMGAIVLNTLPIGLASFISLQPSLIYNTMPHLKHHIQI